MVVGALADRILAGSELSRDEALSLVGDAAPSAFSLFEQANRVREAVFGNHVHVCSIANAKMGGCPEDCAFCSQSAHHKTGVGRTGVISPEEAVAAAERAARFGVGEFSLVTATRGLKAGRDFDTILAGVRRIAGLPRMEAHASLGMLGGAEFRALRDAGCVEFNHNLETSRRHFAKVCTTHTYDDRIATLRNAKAVGMRTCSGGILGMGETPEDRVDLALTLRDLDVDEVPLNFLVGIEGTPLARVAAANGSPSPLELLRFVAIFRLLLPRKNIFICAGRQHLGDLQALIFFAGASGIMIGDFLTTANRRPEDDIKMIADLGFRTG